MIFFIILLLPIMIVGLWYPIPAAIIFIIIVSMIEGYVLIVSKMGTSEDFNFIDWNEKEKILLKKYYIFFRFRATSVKLASVYYYIAMSSFLWVPWLIYNQSLFPLAIIFGLNYFLAFFLSKKLNPMQFNLDAIGGAIRQNKIKEEAMQSSISDFVSIKKMLDKMYLHTGDPYANTKGWEGTEEYKIALACFDETEKEKNLKNKSINDNNSKKESSCEIDTSVYDKELNAKYCSQCGETIVSDESKFCVKCGNKLR